MSDDVLRDLAAKMEYYLQLHCCKSVAREVLRTLMNCQFTKVSTITFGIFICKICYEQQSLALPSASKSLL